MSYSKASNRREDLFKSQQQKRGLIQKPARERESLAWYRVYTWKEKINLVEVRNGEEEEEEEYWMNVDSGEN